MNAAQRGYAHPSNTENVRSTRWRLVRRVGCDALASLYEARHATGARVMMKFLHARLVHDERQRERFLHAKAVARAVALRGVVRVLDDGMTLDGRPYLVTEWVGGETLDNRMRREPSVGPREAVRIALDVLTVIGAAHDAGLVHGDLSPRSIVITEDGTIKVLDFGVMSAWSAGNSDSAVTSMRWGAPHFMAPEQVMGGRSMDARADVWAVGAILFLLLTGEHPYGSLTAAAYVRRCASGPPRRVREVLGLDVHPALAAAVDHALAPSLAERTAGADQLSTELVRAIGENTASATRPGGTVVMTRPASRCPPVATTFARLHRE